MLVKFISSVVLTWLLAACASTQGISVKTHSDQRVVRLPIEVMQAGNLPAPTVLVMHGCGGVGLHHKAWAKRLTSWGYNAVIVDSFSARTRANICVNARVVTPIQRAQDAHLVAKWVKSQVWSTQRVGVLGFSHGGVSVLMAVTSDGAQRYVGGSFIDSAVAYYPACVSSNPFASTKNMPLQIHIGRADDWTPAALCPTLVQLWGMSDNYFEYQGAFHGFDRSNTDRLVRGKGGMHVLRSDAQAAELAFIRTKAFFDATLR